MQRHAGYVPSEKGQPSDLLEKKVREGSPSKGIDIGNQKLVDKDQDWFAITSTPHKKSVTPAVPRREILIPYRETLI